MIKEIIHTIDDLNRDTYTFYLIAEWSDHQPRIIFDSFYMQTRANKRQKWTTISGFSRLRKSHLISMKREDIMLPAWVIEAAKTAFAAEIAALEVQ